MMRYLLIPFLLLASDAAAETLIATRTLQSHTLLTSADVELRPVEVIGGVSEISDIIGMETRVAIYAGRPIRHGDIGPAATVERNQLVRLVYQQNGLTISTEARSLGRGGPGDFIQVMNLSSRTTVSGLIDTDGSVRVTD